MSPISFKNIKLFNKAVIQPRKTQLESPQGEEKSSLLRRILKGPLPFLLITVIVIALLLSYRPSQQLPTLALGEIATMDIVAPFDLTVEDQEEMKKRKIEAENDVLAVYAFDPNVFANTEDQIRRAFSLARQMMREQGAPDAEAQKKAFFDSLGLDLELRTVQSLIGLKFSADIEEILISTLSKVFNRGIISGKSFLIHGEETRGLILLDAEKTERTVELNDILDREESEKLFNSEIDSLDIPERNKSLLKTLSQHFLIPNVTLDIIEFNERRARARSAVEPITNSIKKGRIIIRRGDEAGEETIETIGLYNERLARRVSWLPGFLGSFIFYLLLFLSLWYYLDSILKKDLVRMNFQMMGAFLVASLALYKFSLYLANTVSGSVQFSPFAQSTIYTYAFPFQAGTIIFAFLTSDQLTLTFAILNSLTVGYLLGGDFNIMVFSFAGGLAAIYGIRHFHKISRMAALRAGVFLIAPVNAIVVVIFHLIERQGNLGTFTAEVLMSLLGGVLSAALAFLIIPVMEASFGFITSSKLLELSNSNLPIFKQMSLEAPGSYHHSLIVATVAEKAAEELGLDSQLVKAGALYHDIGKVKRPEYFIENRTRRSDVHKDLTPSMSTLVIVNHVKEGVEIAKKLRLPRVLRDIIEQHHGSSLVRYFFNKAKLIYDPEQQKIGEESYRYPGPPPRTKEAAVVMLADSVEAASRSLKYPTRDNLRRAITDIINSYLQDGQLDDCDISLRELRAVADSFLTILYAVYHPRIEYPGFEFEARKDQKTSKTAKNNDRNHQPPEKNPDSDETS